MALLQFTNVIYHHPLETTTEAFEGGLWTAGVKPDSTVNLAPAKVAKGMVTKVLYDAGLGTVPDSQGWTLTEDEGPAAASVSGGALNSTTTTIAMNQFWQRTDLGSFGNFSVDEYNIEFDLKIIGSTHFDNGVIWRTGWDTFVADANSRGFIFGVSATGVRLSNDLGGPGSSGGIADSTALIATATTDDFHKYTVAVSGDTVRVFKDGSEITSISVGIANAASTNRIIFGDSSIFAFSETQLRTITFPTAKLSGATVSYSSTIGSTKMAYSAWLKNPSAQ